MYTSPLRRLPAYSAILALAAVLLWLRPAYPAHAQEVSGPAFPDAATTRGVDENSPAGTNVGAAIPAATNTGGSLTYSLGGTDAGSFDFDAATRQITVKSGTALDYEAAKNSYSVTVTATDSQDATGAIAVTINVTDVNEPPLAPGYLEVTPQSSTMLLAIWIPQLTTDRPAITGYDYRYRTSSPPGTWALLSVSGSANIVGVISGLTPGTGYDVQVRAKNDEGESPWSASASASTDTAVNTAPVLTEGETATRDLAENVGAATTTGAADLGAAFTATDADTGDTLTYSLEGADAASFDIATTTGQLKTRAGVLYDYEAKPSYSVTVKVEDSNGGSDTIAVTVNLTDVTEKPLAPAAPTVFALSGVSDTLVVTWATPGNTGRPDITRYNFRFRTSAVGSTPAGPWIEPPSSGGNAGNRRHIRRLSAYTSDTLDPGTSYDVGVRALNADGAGQWSPSATAGTNAAGNVWSATLTTDAKGPDSTGSYTYGCDSFDTKRSEISIWDPGPGMADCNKALTDYTFNYLVAPDDPSRGGGSLSITHLNWRSSEGILVLGLSNFSLRVPTDAAAIKPRLKKLTLHVGGQSFSLAGAYTTAYSFYWLVGGLGWTDGQKVDLTMDYTPVTAKRPQRQRDLRASPGDGQVTLSWTDPSISEGNRYWYEFRVAPDDGDYRRWRKAPITGLTASANPVTHTVTGLENGARLLFRVFAANSAGGSAYSLPASATPRATTAAAVKQTHLTARPEASSVTLTWKDPTPTNPALNSYRYRYRTSTGADTWGAWTAAADAVGAYGKARNARPRTVVYTVTGLEIGTAHQFQVRAGNSLNTNPTEWSDAATGTPIGPPPKQTHLTATPRGASVTLTWTDPSPRGSIAGNTYSYLYRARGASRWTEGEARSATVRGDKVTYTVKGLKNGKQYRFKVRAANGYVTSEEWSDEARAAPGNNPPVFTEGDAATRSLDENRGGATTTMAASFGAAVAATDGEGGKLWYTLVDADAPGADANSFTIDRIKGRLQTKAGVRYDHERKASYALTAKVIDGQGGEDTIAVTVVVNNKTEKPPATDAPTVTATTGSSDSLTATWTAPDNTGRPAIDSYDLRYRKGTRGRWTRSPRHASGLTATITGLKADSNYQVQARATNSDGDGPWSNVGSGRTGAQANNEPSFTAGDTARRRVQENRGAATTTAPANLGAAFTATDDDNDTLTYSLADASTVPFTIDSSTGRLGTKIGALYDYEAKKSYSVTVRVSDSKDANGGADTAVDDTIAVTVMVDNKTEKPPATDAPTVTATTGSSASLTATWTAPDNTGRPAIDSYDLRYRKGKRGAWSGGPRDVSGLTATITSLRADSNYQVQVRATNADGAGPWSNAATGRTNAP